MDGWALATALGLLAAFAGLSLWVRRRAWGLAPVEAGALTIEGRVRLAPGVEVVVVAWGEQRLLLARDAAGVRVLSALPALDEASDA